jgi:RNA polymerase sigma factor (TIGR02999 family)
MLLCTIVSMDEGRPLTDLIQRAQQGDEQALRAVFEATYQELRVMARARLSRNARGTLLDTTSLVHESFLRLARAGRMQVEHREHFMRYASHVMRSVVVDLVRESMADRRGGDVQHITLAPDVDDEIKHGEEQILQVHEALDGLARYDPRLLQVVEMRYFAGMTESEIAVVLGVTDRTVRRDWQKAKLLLAEALKV